MAPTATQSNNAAIYASSLIKSTKPDDIKNNYQFPTPENPGDRQLHTLMQQRIPKELHNFSRVGKSQPSG